MATQTVAAPVARSRWGRLIFRAVLVLLGLILVLALVAFILLYVWGHSSLPQLDGTLAVSGLQAPVDVIRDEHGVPHITVASLDDLFFAQGYITAQDRLWQMDMTRRFAGGELAEILPASSGPASAPSRFTGAPRRRMTWLDLDKQQRILRLRAVAERVAQQLPARDRKFFEDYARGVNAYIEQSRDHLPLEFRILRYAPKPWTAADSVLVGISMSQLLNPQYETEYWREKIGTKLSPELMADLYPVVSWRDRPPASAANDGAAILTVPDEPEPEEDEEQKPTPAKDSTRLMAPARF